ncbi:MAG: SCO family protein [Chitinophagaceae bacterium]|jgi:protein SCO1/2|nr:SCO family protein [Chitinophagaceae bacterium]
MQRNKFVAILIAVILPLGTYLVVSNLSENAVTMPRRYFYDSVGTTTIRGKTVPDTLWHKIRPFRLQNQLGDTVGLEALAGRIVIVDFFFTSCPSICPTLTRNMKKLQQAFVKTDSMLRFVSFTVDPDRDSVARLKAYGDRYGINHDTWWMLTGPKAEIYDIALHEFKANIAQEEGVDTNFIHTDKFFLLDKDRVLRGWYSGLDSVNLDRLIKDVVLLNMERDKKKKRNLFRK